VRPFVQLPARSIATLADVSGPGLITCVYLTSDILDLGDLRLRMFWDGAPDPAVDVVLARFFCLGGRGQAHIVTSIPITVGPVRGCSSYWPMPFGTHAQLTLENTGDTAAHVIAYKVTYEELDVPPEGIRFHARTESGQPDPATAEYTVAQLSGRGFYVGTALNWQANAPRWWGEGEFKFYLGNDEFPTLVDTGTEDYFGGAWGFGRDSGFLLDGPTGETAYSGPFAGVPYLESDESRPRAISLYRWHLLDPIGFDDGLRVAVQGLGQGPDGRYEIRSQDLLTSTAYWYERVDEASA
jgi:hypothetical protein